MNDKRQDPLIGRQLANYRLDRLLGRGGMARVYRGVDLQKARYVAIKVIDAFYRDQAAAVERFEREAQVVSQLDGHPNIVRLYRYGEADGYLFIAMQYIDGVDLDALLTGFRKDGQWMPFEDVLSITKNITDALDFIHSRDVVHRDLKPSNIMIDRSGRAILTDFGLALVTDVGTLGQVFGSPAYIAPEQAVSSANACPESDLYALGAVLFEMLTGQPPFSADDAMAMALKHINEPPPAPSSLRKELGKGIDRVILKALAKRPEERYSDGAQLYADLEQAVLRLQRYGGEAPPTLARVSIHDRVQAGAERLPKLPQYPPDLAQPVKVGSGGGGRIPPATSYTSPGWEENAGPYVIPVREQSKSRGWLSITAIALGAALVLGLVCAGSLLALRALTPGGPAAVAASPSPSITVLAQATQLPPTTTVSPTPTRPPATETPPPTDTRQPSLTPSIGVLVLARLSQNHLLIMNDGDRDINLEPLRIGDRYDGIVGQEMGIPVLEPGKCLAVAYPGKNFKPPANLQCRLILVVEREQESGFWIYGPFPVYYHNQLVGECNREEACVLSIPEE